jgi:predicted membrane protein
MTLTIIAVSCLDSVVAVAKPITVLYFWSFVVIAYFILFNMVLAVIFTVYDEEYDDMKQEIKNEEKDRQEVDKLMAAASVAGKKKKARH